jgi:hypothetical protein
MDGCAIYFVGAGLPKALQRADFPVPLMWDFVRVAAVYASTDNVLLTTLTQLELGRVFEHSTPASIALAAKIAPSNAATAAERTAFLNMMSSRPQENIEHLLIRADQLATDPANASLPWSDLITLELLPLRFSFAINRVFWHIGWNFSAEPLHRFLREELPRHDSSTFVSFNYDVMLEHGIEDVAPEAWCAANGYGSVFSEFVEVVAANRHIGHSPTIGTGGPVGTLKSHNSTRTYQGNITVLKPHGSLNWLCQFTGNYHFVGYPTHLVLSADERVAYLSGNNPRIAGETEWMAVAQRRNLHLSTHAEDAAAHDPHARGGGDCRCKRGGSHWLELTYDRLRSGFAH